MYYNSSIQRYIAHHSLSTVSYVTRASTVSKRLTHSRRITHCVCNDFELELSANDFELELSLVISEELAVKMR